MEQIKNPYYETLEAITRAKPPEFCKGIFNSNELDDDQITELQDWCGCNSQPVWATGLGHLEAADHIVNVAIENRNICDKMRSQKF